MTLLNVWELCHIIGLLVLEINVDDFSFVILQLMIWEVLLLSHHQSLTLIWKSRQTLCERIPLSSILPLCFHLHSRRQFSYSLHLRLGLLLVIVLIESWRNRSLPHGSPVSHVLALRFLKNVLIYELLGFQLLISQRAGSPHSVCNL